MDNTKIEWTDATWNPVIGCQKVSPGCAHCYAERLAPRLGLDFSQITLKPERLDQPLRWRRPRRIFVNSLSDMFLEGIPDPFIDQVFAVMALATQHTFQLLTKRPERMLAYLLDPKVKTRILAACTKLNPNKDLQAWMDGAGWPLPNVWLGTSVENQHWANIRVPLLLRTPAAVRFLSVEPMLGPVNLRGWFPHERELSQTRSVFIEGVDWVIVGGESGPKARPMDPAWARSLRDQCLDYGVPFLFKQWGEFLPEWFEGSARNGHVNGYNYVKVGKSKAGRDLDGRTWDGYPAVKP